MNESYKNIIYSTIFGICVGILLYFANMFSVNFVIPVINIVIPDVNIDMILFFYYSFVIFCIFHTVDYFLQHSFLT
jgi:hypothetical protein